MTIRFTRDATLSFCCLPEPRVIPAQGLRLPPPPHPRLQRHQPKRLPFISPIVGDNIVLQRGKADALWGWSEPGDRIQVEIGSAKTPG
jgi:hypothetical protein